MFADHFVYEVATRLNPESYTTVRKFYKRAYMVNADGKVILAEDATEVMRKIMYDPITANNMKYKRKDDVNVGNENVNILVQGGAFSEKDREWLEGLDPDRLAQLSTAYEKKVEAPAVNEEKMDIPTVVQALAEQFKTPEQYIPTDAG